MCPLLNALKTHNKATPTSPNIASQIFAIPNTDNTKINNFTVNSKARTCPLNFSG